MYARIVHHWDIEAATAMWRECVGATVVEDDGDVV